MKFHVCCVGHMCTDVLAKPVDALPEKGKLQLIDTVELMTGGCAMNTAIGLAKLGTRVAMVGKTGDDGFGNFMQDTLVVNSVNTGGLIRESGGMTSVSVVTIGSDGERTILHCLGTNSTLTFDDIDLAVIDDSKLLFIGGTFLLPRFDGADAAKLLAYAQGRGTITAMDTAWDASGRWMRIIKPCLEHLEWFMPSVEEAEQMVGTRDPKRIAAELKKQGVKNVAVKLGSRGCYIEPAEDEGRFLKTFDVDVVDTAGAGDAWCAGFLSALIKGKPLYECAVWGNAVGSLCVTKVGTTAGIKNEKETQAFINSQS